MAIKTAVSQEQLAQQTSPGKIRVKNCCQSWIWCFSRCISAVQTPASFPLPRADINWHLESDLSKQNWSYIYWDGKFQIYFISILLTVSSKMSHLASSVKWIFLDYSHRCVNIFFTLFIYFFTLAAFLCCCCMHFFLIYSYPFLFQTHTSYPCRHALTFTASRCISTCSLPVVP